MDALVYPEWLAYLFWWLAPSLVASLATQWHMQHFSPKLEMIPEDVPPACSLPMTARRILVAPRMNRLLRFLLSKDSVFLYRSKVELFDLEGNLLHETVGRWADTNGISLRTGGPRAEGAGPDWMGMRIGEEKILNCVVHYYYEYDVAYAWNGGGSANGDLRSSCFRLPKGRYIVKVTLMRLKGSASVEHLLLTVGRRAAKTRLEPLAQTTNALLSLHSPAGPGFP